MLLREIKAKKIPYTELDEESKEYVYDMFKKYVVRKQIADNNKVLSSIFSRLSTRGMKTSYPSDYTANFNQFNSAFIGTNLISHLDYDEIHTGWLHDMSEDRFNFHLNERGNSFYRKMALICFSGRPSERIANRVDLPVMIAYANMQTLVLKLREKNPSVPMHRIINHAAEEIHKQFYQKNGYALSSSRVLEKRVDYKAVARKASRVWKEMMEFYKTGLEDFRILEAVAFVKENFVFTEEQEKFYDDKINRSMQRASIKVADDRAMAQERMDNDPDGYIPADYDEVFSKWYAEEVYSDIMKPSMHSIFDFYLRDPIYEEKDPKKKGE